MLASNTILIAGGTFYGASHLDGVAIDCVMIDHASAGAHLE